MRAVCDVQSVGLVRFLVGDAEVVEDGLRRVADRHLVHQESAEPEPAAEVVVLLHDHGLDAALGEFLRRDQPGRAAADDDDVRFRELGELVAPRGANRSRHFRLAHVRKAIECLHTTQ
ncbi:hypothetical protein BG842_25985 [Haladaptatus sp. W1]|nr:hypothetical protein BG842_25985 [Haladaptatus sp. W1]